MKEKKPDAVVFDEETQAYNAHLLPYASNVGAPAIKTTDLTHWKNHKINKVNHQLENRFELLKQEYLQLRQDFEDNEMVYSAQFNFEPVMGKSYFLYEKENGSHFLSLIAPEECNFSFKGEFTLTLDGLWERKGANKEKIN
ncbi:DUF2452 domain-containing protein [Croceiramulus getboli]|nr:DUF2452 domain-containing protein [Flavobacteriaceae bacterium YJPT1-3]